MKGTCFAHFLDCHEIVVQPQLIHYFLLRQVQQPNTTELWFLVAERYVRFSISEFCIVTGLRCSGDSDTGIFESRQSQLKNKYFSQVDIVTHEDVKSTFISACQMLDLDLVETLPDHDIEICDLMPTEAKMAMPYMDGTEHNKTIQPESSQSSRRKESRKGKSVDPSHMSEKSMPLVTDTGVRKAHITNDDDDFVDPLRRCKGLSH
ncbi:Hypothetical predicted protein [Olea europaea subsp. europaea]|uniref:DUF1985 domain-containing protein n=1 Tax=Olea europaea subsp. europaea TaxID=158383 RepID=A0A8S0QE55_OLEEU|nr:Hypothetical predicted protein [Olea europaea subsp. europaea]